MPPKTKKAAPAQENVSLGPLAGDGTFCLLSYRVEPIVIPTNMKCSIGKLVFGVARIFASFNDTFVHVTDLSCVPPKHQFTIIGSVKN